MFAAAAIFGLAGCAAVGPDPVPPEVPIPSGWHRVDGTQLVPDPVPAERLEQWWQQLADTALTELVVRALEASPDLASAQARVREARARRALAGANLLPSITATGAASSSRSSEETGPGRTAELYSAGFDAAWEPDVFGGRRRAVEGATADVEQAVANLAATRVTLVAEVALNYVDARAFQARLEIARNNLATQSETLQLTGWRAQAGLASALDVEQSRAAVEQTRAQIPSLETSLALAQHRIAILIGREPAATASLFATLAPIPPVPDRIALGIPADTLRRRPDVQAAERKLAAETARVGEAMAQRYPSFTLSGSIGLEALTLGALGRTGAIARSLLGRVSGVLFDAGRIESQVRIRESVRDQAQIAYQSAILTALQDVENALTALANSRRRQVSLQEALDAARNAALLASQRYGSGLIDFQVVLDSQRTVLGIEDSLAVARAEGTSALIRLYKALGGGWSAAQPNGADPVRAEGSPS